MLMVFCGQLWGVITDCQCQSDFQLPRWVSSSAFKSVSPLFFSFLLNMGSGIRSIFKHLMLLFLIAT